MFKITKSFSKQAKKLLKSKKGFFVDTGVKILICVVLGSLVLGGLYTTFNGTIMPSVKSKVESMFEYGTGSGTGGNVSTIEIVSCGDKFVIRNSYPMVLATNIESIKSVYCDSKELIYEIDYFTTPKENNNTLVLIISDFVNTVSSGEHTIKVVTDNGVLYHTVSK